MAAPRHSDGAWWADLSPLSDDSLLMPTVSDAVGLADHAQRMPVEALCEWLADKQLLLVLDSCEHLRAPCGHLLGEILTTSPGLTVLATSRQPFAIHCEQTVQVQPLPVEGPGDALVLFRDRARAADPRATLDTEAQASAVIEICRRLEGIPLAIELAAAGIGQHTVEQTAVRLGSRFDVLTDDSLWPRRHRALRTTIGWSHELCTPLERLLWARLTPCAPTSTRPSPRRSAPTGRSPRTVSPRLRGLVAKSVVKRDGERHHMLDTIREYGRMWLAELGEEQAAADRHAACFLDLARRAHAGWTGPDQVSWSHRISTTHLDLCAALDHLLVHDVRAGQEMAGRVGFFWGCCGHLSRLAPTPSGPSTPPAAGPRPHTAAVGTGHRSPAPGRLGDRRAARCAVHKRRGPRGGRRSRAQRRLSLRSHPADDQPPRGRPAHGRPGAPADRDGAGGAGLPAALPPHHRLRPDRRGQTHRGRRGRRGAASRLRGPGRVLDPLVHRLPTRPDRPSAGPPPGRSRTRQIDAGEQATAPRRLRYRPRSGHPRRGTRRPGRGVRAARCTARDMRTGAWSATRSGHTGARPGARGVRTPGKGRGRGDGLLACLRTRADGECGGGLAAALETQSHT
ncbi:hypothetical protein NKH18_12570 [Streptomyces sp. M10(2022)]